jgi:hypothetical protein
MEISFSIVSTEKDSLRENEVKEDGSVTVSALG